MKWQFDENIRTNINSAEQKSAKTFAYKSRNVQNLLFWENKTENARFTN